MRWGVVVFPGSNCDHDAYDVLKRIFAQQVRFIWHKERDLTGLDAILLPGGFAYGDYLRAGAIAKFSPVVEEVVRFAENGGVVLGICNGFQVLTEAGLLPGSLRWNRGLRFICEDLAIRVEHTESPFTSQCSHHQVLTIPVAHNEGNFTIRQEELTEVEKRNQVLFRYCSATGEVNEESNPNGSMNNIAGITNEQGNVLGMMPHPERRCDPLIGSVDGQVIFQSIIQSFE